jgi:dihydrofolate reductase
MKLKGERRIHSTPTSSSGAVRFNKVCSKGRAIRHKEAEMYTGKLIDELIQSVQRAEEDARIYRDEELIQQFLDTHVLDASYITNYVGVA